MDFQFHGSFIAPPGTRSARPRPLDEASRGPSRIARARRHVLRMRSTSLPRRGDRSPASSSRRARARARGRPCARSSRLWSGSSKHDDREEAVPRALLGHGARASQRDRVQRRLVQDRERAAAAESSTSYDRPFGVRFTLHAHVEPCVGAGRAAFVISAPYSAERAFTSARGRGTLFLRLARHRTHRVEVGGEAAARRRASWKSSTRRDSQIGAL